MAERGLEQPNPRGRTFKASAKLVMRRFYYRQLDPSIITRRIKHWYYSDTFSKKRDGAERMTREHIRRRFDQEFRRSHGANFLMPQFQAVAYHFVSERVPASQRTRKALEGDAINRHTLNMVTEGFIQGMILGKFGWSYRKTNDGFEQLMFRDGGEWQVIETTNAHIPAQKKESDARLFNKIMKKNFG